MSLLIDPIGKENDRDASPDSASIILYIPDFKRSEVSFIQATMNYCRYSFD